MIPLSTKRGARVWYAHSMLPEVRPGRVWSCEPDTVVMDSPSEGNRWATQSVVDARQHFFLTRREATRAQIDRLRARATEAMELAKGLLLAVKELERSISVMEGPQ